MFYAALFVIIFFLFVLGTTVHIVPQTQIYIIERLGTYSSSWSSGLHFRIPFFEQIVNKVSMKENVIDFPPQSVITKDNVTIKIDTVIFYQITDAKRNTYGVENAINAIDKLTATTLRNIIGDMELDQTLTSRDQINGKITTILDEASDKWGIKVNRVELKNIEPPRQVLEAMEKQMRAERERRAMVTQAEGTRDSEINLAEGKKRAKILEAEGEAEAILTVQKAMAQALRLLNDANPTQEVLTLKSLEAFAQAANGQATTMIIPSQIQGIAGLAASLGEIIKNNRTQD